MAVSLLSSLISVRSVEAEFCRTWDSHHSPAWAYFLKLEKEKAKRTQFVLPFHFGQVKIIKARGKNFGKISHDDEHRHFPIFNDIRM
ncbi:MAG: hypothetical protein ACSNEK_06190 [Parachlamydiaceae bacterium]